MPATYAWIIRTSREPYGRVARSAATCVARNASVCALGTNALPERARPSGGRPACAKGDVLLGLPGDVRYAEAVANDRDTRARPFRPARPILAEPERCGLEVPLDVALSALAATSRGPVVELGLVG